MTRVQVVEHLIQDVRYALRAMRHSRGFRFASLLFGVRAIDPPTIVVATATMTAVAALAGYLPARRASRVDPMVTLRSE